NAIMWKVGHSLIKAKMKQVGAVLAGEMSGHIFFAHRYLGFDDAIYAGARLLELLSCTDRTLDELVDTLPAAINTPEIRMDMPDDIKVEVVRRAVERFRRDRQVVDVVDIDGARILYADGWGLVRASNTQPALVLRFEARTAEALARIREEVETALAAIRKELPACSSPSASIRAPPTPASRSSTRSRSRGSCPSSAASRSASSPPPTPTPSWASSPTGLRRSPAPRRAPRPPRWA